MQLYLTVYKIASAAVFCYDFNMQLLQQNERNKVFKTESSVLKYFSSRDEFYREKEALLILRDSQINFVIQEVENIDEEKLCIQTKLIPVSYLEKQEKIKLLDKVENQSRLIDFMHQFHVLSSKVPSNDLAGGVEGVMNKALREGLYLKDPLEIKAVEEVQENAHRTIAFYEQLKPDKFVHGDIQPDNMLFDESGELIGFLDWGSSGRGVVEMDIRQLPCYFGQSGIAICKMHGQNFKIHEELLRNLVLARFLELCFNYSQREDSPQLYSLIYSNLKTFVGRGM
jgi:serine/threonine protein kinase